MECYYFMTHSAANSFAHQANSLRTSHYFTARWLLYCSAVAVTKGDRKSCSPSFPEKQTNYGDQHEGKVCSHSRSGLTSLKMLNFVPYSGNVVQLRIIWCLVHNKNNRYQCDVGLCWGLCAVGIHGACLRVPVSCCVCLWQSTSLLQWCILIMPPIPWPSHPVYWFSHGGTGESGLPLLSTSPPPNPLTFWLNTPQPPLTVKCWVVLSSHCCWPVVWWFQLNLKRLAFESAAGYRVQCNDIIIHMWITHKIPIRPWGLPGRGWWLLKGVHCLSHYDSSTNLLQSAFTNIGERVQKGWLNQCGAMIGCRHCNKLIPEISSLSDFQQSPVSGIIAKWKNCQVADHIHLQSGHPECWGTLFNSIIFYLYSTKSNSHLSVL